jgi:hypothetical protein
MTKKNERRENAKRQKKEHTHKGEISNKINVWKGFGVGRSNAQDRRTYRAVLLLPLSSSHLEIMTVQAPHPPSLQPNFDPVKCKSSRKNCNKVWWGRARCAIFSGTIFPLTYNRGIVRYDGNGMFSSSYAKQGLLLRVVAAAASTPLVAFSFSLGGIFLRMMMDG